MTPPMDYSENEESIDGVIRQIRALLNDSGGRNMPRVFSAFNGFWPTVRSRTPLEQPGLPTPVVSLSNDACSMLGRNKLRGSFSSLYFFISLLALKRSFIQARNLSGRVEGRRGQPAAASRPNFEHAARGAAQWARNR